MRPIYIITLTNNWLGEMFKNRSKTGNINRQSQKPKNREFDFDIDIFVATAIEQFSTASKSKDFIRRSRTVLYYKEVSLKSREPKKNRKPKKSRKPKKITEPKKSREPKFDDFKIEYKPHFRTSLSSISQLINSTQKMGINEPKNYFEIELQKWFDVAPKKFVQSFEKCLKNTCDDDYDVREYNLMGPLRKGVRISLYDDYTEYYDDDYTEYYDDDYLVFASLGRTILPHLKQRIDFIINRKCPSIYTGTEREIFFGNMQSDLKEFRKEIELFNIDFMDAIEYAKQKN